MTIDKEFNRTLAIFKKEQIKKAKIKVKENAKKALILIKGITVLKELSDLHLSIQHHNGVSFYFHKEVLLIDNSGDWMRGINLRRNMIDVNPDSKNPSTKYKLKDTNIGYGHISCDKEVSLDLYEFLEIIAKNKREFFNEYKKEMLRQPWFTQANLDLCSV